MASSSNKKSVRSTKKSTLLSWGYSDWLEILETETRNRSSFVTKVRCKICLKYESKIKGQRNYNSTWCSGTSNTKKDTVTTHLNSDSHKLARKLEEEFRMTPGPLPSYAATTIGRAIYKLNETEKERISKLLEIAYVIAKEELPFTKFVQIAKLEKKHGVDLGVTYLNDHACAEFIDSIAEVYEEELNELLQKKVHYISILVDGSTDSSNTEKELIYILYLDPVQGKPKIRFFSLKKLDHATSEGLLETIRNALKDHGITSLKDNIVGLGADGASVNFGLRGGLATLMKNEGIDWLVPVHCVSHKLELAIADALKPTTVFSDINDMIVKVYYLYKNSPKKMRQLKGLGEALEKSVSPPVKAQSTRWLEHKIRALSWISKNYGLLITHLNHMSEDTTYKSTDRAKFKGMYGKYRNAKFPLYVEYFLEVLTPAAELSLHFQRESIDVVGAVQGLKHFFRIMEKLNASSELILFTGRVKRFIEQIDTSDYVHQEVKLTYADMAKTSLQNSNNDILCSILDCFKQRFDKSDSVFNALVKVLDTELYPQAEANNSSTYGIEELRLLIKRFQEILTANGCDVTRIESEWDYVKELVATTGLKGAKYTDTWAKLFTSTKKESLTNILHLVEILLVIPISNATLERMFSAMNRVHTDWRNCLGEKRVENLLRIFEEGSAIEQYDPKAALSRWCNKCATQRRPSVQPSGPRNQPEPTASGSKRTLPQSDVIETAKKLLLIEEDDT